MTKTERWVCRVAVLAAAVVLPLYALKVHQKTDYSDYLVYFRTAERIVQGQWSLIYDFFANENCPYRYSPPTLPIFSAFGLLPYNAGRLLWYFIQFACYVAGFQVLRTALKPLARDKADVICALSFLFVLRYILDSFTIGQITGTLFLFLALGLRSWLSDNPARALGELSIPTALKIGPGLVIAPVVLNSKPKATLKAALSVLAVILILDLWLWKMTGSLSEVAALWRDWINMLANDNAYFDSSHYGSQSINSMLLRWRNLGWLPSEAGHMISTVIRAALGAAILGFWIFRRPVNPRGRALFFSTAVLAYLWLMPATFKYSMPLLAFPVAVLWVSPLSRKDRWALGFGAATLSLAGMDVIGERAFFWIQKQSIPLLAMIWIGACVFSHAWKESRRVGS